MLISILSNSRNSCINVLVCTCGREFVYTKKQVRRYFHSLYGQLQR